MQSGPGLMRRFDDPEGRAWEVVAGRESWGSFFAIFIPVEGHADAPVLQAPLAATSYEEAALVLDGLEVQALRDLLRRSHPKSP